ACTSHPMVKPSSGKGALWGYVELVRRSGVKPPAKNDPVYANSKFKNVELVDYSQPGFAVAYVDGLPSPEGTTKLVIRDAGGGKPEFATPNGVVGVGGRIVLRNEDSLGHVISCSELEFFGRLEPGEEVEIDAGLAGEAKFFVLDRSDDKALVFVAPGPWCAASEDGRWLLNDLPPGDATIQVWHPRLPSAAQTVTVRADEALRVDLSVGVDNLETN
ncbi:MAG: carboxypeptidase-like regulatory domain-containing protein, partial [Planctomycetota bacterium]